MTASHLLARAWSLVLSVLGLRVDDPERQAAAEEIAQRTRDEAKQEWNGRRGPPIVGG